MRTVKLFLLVIIFIFPFNNTWGCDCLWGGSFLHSINESDIIFIGEIIDYDNYSFIERGDTSFYYPSVMIVKIKEILMLKENKFTVSDFMKPNRPVRVLGNIKSNCRPNVSKFKLGSKWVFKMQKAEKYNYFNIDLIVFNCATNYLKIENEKVFGNIEGENQKMKQDGVNIEMSIAELRKKIVALSKE